MAQGLSRQDLPNDILVEVFSYLPAKSVGRFRSLSSSWRAVLTSASFDQMHLRRANNAGEFKVFFSVSNGTPEEKGSHHIDGAHGDDTAKEESYGDDGTPEEASCFYGWQPGGVATKLTPHNFHLPTPLTKPLHGLVLIRDTGYHVFNPCTGAALALPDTDQPAKMIWRPTRRQVKLPSYFYVTYGLGYCSVTGHYKVVRLFSRGVDSPVLCEVFVLGMLDYWRPTTQQTPMCIIDEQNPGVFLHGHLHFLCHDLSIVSFDVTREAFGSILPPPIVEYAPVKMTEIDGCLCLCLGQKNYDDGTYHIWILRNYKEGKWEQLCRLDPTAWTEPERVQLDSNWIAPLGMYITYSGHKKIMFDTASCKVFVMDVPNGNTPEVIFNPDETVGGCFEDFTEPSLGLYEESLVPVGHTVEEMILSSPKTKAWFDILKWMSTRSVAELSLVCRAWRAMVKDDTFIRSHVAHANLNKSPRIMMIMDPTFGRYMDLEDIIDKGEVTYPSTYLVCSQPCHGLNAGTSHSGSFICNPVRGHVQNIVLDRVDDDTFFAGQTGLGYDLKNNIHMLVFFTYKVKNLATREYQLESKLRYVDERECRLLDPPPRPVANVTPTYVDGKIFWLVDSNLGPVSLNYEIVAFDVHTKGFEVLEGPPCSSQDNGHVSILRLHNSLCVSCSDKINNVIDIWMMKDVGIWTVEYHLELEEFSQEYSPERTTPLAVNPVDGRILLSTGRSLGYYDLEMAALETLYREVDMRWSFCPVICDESFVKTFRDG